MRVATDYCINRPVAVYYYIGMRINNRYKAIVSLLVLFIGAVESFSTPLQQRIVQNNVHASKSNNQIINDEECRYQTGDVDRRQFFISMVGAASLVVLSEDAAAVDIKSQKEELSISSTLISSSSDVVAAGTPIDTKEIFGKAAKKALGGGKAGAAAAVVQVFSLMWLR